ncbi:MAG: tRNA (adenosine(37)-N6)-dimethylallyltransferase MiaA [Sinobacterium sp.]|nr:tRNA (adenosine(37)-N6)-dimethylallyltransferase MiaA [Sinobacterium sp.]
MRLQDELNGEIISVDSALIYKGLNIGSAKPTPDELAVYPHHLVDILDPAESYNAADFRRDALALMHDIVARGKTPLLVGGTMMYFKVLLEGMGDLPSASPSVRAEIDATAKEKGWGFVHDELAKVDPESAARINVNDPQRLQRALEVYKISGTTMTEFRRLEALSKPDDPLQHFPFDVVQLALAPEDRSVLHQRIEQRFIKMCEHGFKEEVIALRARPDLHVGLASMRCVGYRQMWLHLDGDYDYDEMVFKGVVATRQLAKRQLTWLRGWKSLNWIYTTEQQHVLSKNELLDFMLERALRIIGKHLNP